MSTDPRDDKAAQAREGLIGSIAGKAKEVAGALTGRDDLVQEGDLQQAAARKRKAALAEEALADAKLTEATQELHQTSRETTEQVNAAKAQADHEKSAVEQQRASEHATAARDAERQEATGSANAEQTAGEIAKTRLDEADALAAQATAVEQQAAAEELRLEREAAAADHQAAQLRAQTKNGGTS